MALEDLEYEALIVFFLWSLIDVVAVNCHFMRKSCMKIVQIFSLYMFHKEDKSMEQHEAE